jgi:asparagine synthase (glutamine-hydrolysing)
MCGIVTVFSPDEPIDAERLRKATQALHHRGPDGQRQWLAPDRCVGMGHARLSIIDLNSGDQPIANEDESVHIVVNGEFYDHDRIRGELLVRGHQLRTHSDSEIAIHLYEDLGTHCLEQLRGEFAFVLWDARSQVLFAARDRFGIKPLYYAELGNKIYLASEAKALFAAGVPAAWDPESVHQKLLLALDNDRSMFAHIKQVPPGHYLLATRFGSRLIRYWDANFPTLEDARKSALTDQDHIERMRHGLLEATRLRLRADVQVGCYLSGGLDSCTLLGMASTLHARAIEAFTISFEEEAFDERPFAEEMAARAGANFHCFEVSSDMRADRFADAIWHSEMLHGNGNSVSKFLLSKHVRDFGFKVVLTGEGSDEILGGYPHFRQDMVMHSSGSDAATIEKNVGEIIERNKEVGRFMLPSGDGLPTENVRQALGFVPTWIQTAASRALWGMPLLAREFRQQFADRDPYRQFLNCIDVAGQLKGRDPVNQSLYLWSKTMLPDIMLNLLGDRMEMAHSIEGRTPFLDHELVQRVNAMPPHIKIRGITEKYVLREAARPYVTDTIYRRQKHPFVSPPALTGRFNQLLQDTLRSPSFASVPFFDFKAIGALLDRLPQLKEPEERFRASWGLLTALSAHTLQTRYGL